MSDLIWFLIILSPLVIYFGRLLFTQILVPYFKKKSLLEQMSKRSDWPDIRRKVDVLEKLFKSNYTKLTSVVFRCIHRIKSRDFIYGEIDFLSFHNILEKTKPQPNELFYDLGSGAGKAVFAAALYFNFSKSCGIELLEPLHEKASDTLNKTKSMAQSSLPEEEMAYLKKCSDIEFINDSFLNYDFSDANVLYVAATCLTDTTWESLVKKLANLKQGTRIIVATYTLQHDKFKLIYQGIQLMGWGLCPVKIYVVQ